jgi:3-oxoacyl-[acyl-carrier protein] reductase
MSKTILITGTSRGIGQYLAKYYTSHGNIVIGCSRTESEYKDKNYNHIKCDITNEKNVKSLFRDIKKNYSGLDILINNAGVASMNHSLLTNTSTVRKIFEVNFVSTFLFCREAAKLMQIKKFGRIVNFSTVAVPLSIEGESIYASSKSAVNTLTKILSKEFGKFGITVNLIGPTPIKTDLIRSVPENKLNKLIKTQSIKRYGNFRDVSNVIDFFINEKSDFITGQKIYLGGI